MNLKDNDRSWKNVIEKLFKSFMLFASPDAYRDIDWSRKPRFLDKELRQVAPEFAVKKRIADILASVTLKDKSEAWIAVHVEIQSQKDIHFAERMYIYNHRIWERFKKEVFSIALLTDKSKTWKPTQFSRGKWGLSLNMQFPVVKLLDFKGRQDELSKSKNPFALIVLAYLQALKSSRNPSENYQTRLQIMRLFLRRGYPKKYILAILEFIGAILKVPEPLEDQFWEELRKQQGEKVMPYVLPFIKEAIEQGTEIGQQQGRQIAYIKAMKAFLSSRFGRKKAAPAIERLYGIEDSNALESLLEITCKAKTLDEILANYPKAKASPKKASKVKKTKAKPATKHRSKAKKPSSRKG